MKKQYEPRNWAYRPFIPAETALYGGMHKGFGVHIVRLSVEEKSLELEWLPYPNAVQYRVTVARRGESVGFANNAPEGLPAPQLLPSDQNSCRFCGLFDGVDYEVTVFAFNKDGKQIARSFNRLFRAGKFSGKVINYIHPDDYTYGFSGRSITNPDILQLPDGTFLASHQIVWDQGECNLTQLFRSDDKGNSWNYVVDICPCCGGKLFWHEDSLYLLGVEKRHGYCLISRSDDCGVTWSLPTVIWSRKESESWEVYPILSPTVICEKRIWIALVLPKEESADGGTVILSAPTDSNLIGSESWTISSQEDILPGLFSELLCSHAGERAEEAGESGENKSAKICTEQDIYMVAAEARNGAWNRKTPNAMVFNHFTGS